MYFAHSADDRAHWEPLELHLRMVADRAARYALPFGAKNEARWIGLLHDLGKYSGLFLRRLHGQERHLDHWSIGAWAAARKLGRDGIAAAAAIEGHHIGLQSAAPDCLRDLRSKIDGSKRSDGCRTTSGDHELLLERFAADGLSLPEVFTSLCDQQLPQLVRMFDVRMLFSCLVDADYVETEAHFEGQGEGRRRYRPEGPDLAARRAVETLDAHLDDLAAGSDASERVRRLRADLRRACEEAAREKPGLFTLTAPTGTGKTLSMLAFALRHAFEHGLRRVVMVIPYLTIIEQTARVYRALFKGVFDDNYILEHHSLTESRHWPKGDEKDDENDPEHPRLARLLAENWDAPIVLTTNVQLLQSLFANRPRPCRKLHRLAQSVVLFDEAQTLPPSLAVPTLAALSRLAERYGSSVVFSTATQPAFEQLDDDVRAMAPTGWRPVELVPSSLGLFGRARRTRVLWGDLTVPVHWNELADELAGREQVLVIVNLKRHALSLLEDVGSLRLDGVSHLSTNLCPAHREQVLGEVRRRLEDGKPCRLVATQCVEAGVDVDFPTVFRALGPLEAIAQAAGRCNRRGNLDHGEVVVFLPNDDGQRLYPPGYYENAAEVTRQMLADEDGGELDIDDPETFREYYRKLYRRTRIADSFPDLRKAIDTLSFVEVAKLYRVIAEDTIQVVVPYDLPVFRRLCDEARQERLNRGWIAKARSHVVSIYRPKPSDETWNVLEPVLLRNGEESGDWYLHLSEEAYHRELLGLRKAEDLWIA